MTLQPIYSRTAIEIRITELAAILDKRFNDCPSPHIIGVLKGGFIFVSDLVRAMSIPVTVDFIRASSYGAHTRSSGKPQLLDLPNMEINNRDVILVEDIVETGLTLKAIRASVLNHHPRSLTTVALLVKPSQHQVNVSVDLVGFNIGKEYVVGYGLDADERYRNLPYLAVIENPNS